jgi:catechol 2,3-dioxygenase-like lactoylglutathione lyase family enzyme
MHHAGIVVPDLDSAVTFYCELAGFEAIRKSSWDASNTTFNQIIGLDNSAAKFCMLKGKNGFLELFEYVSPTSEAAPERRSANDLGIRHLCFEVDNVRAALDRVVELGGSRINDPVTNDAGITAVYCRDPFGNLLELVTPAPGGPFRSLITLNEEQ